MTMEALKEIQAEQEVISQRLSVLETTVERIDQLDEDFETLKSMVSRIQKLMIDHIKIMNKQALKISELELRLKERDTRNKEKPYE